MYEEKMQLCKAADTDCIYAANLIWYTVLVELYSSSSSVYSLFCVFSVCSSAKKGSETVTFSLQVNTAAMSETSSDSKATDRHTGTITIKNKVSTHDSFGPLQRSFGPDQKYLGNNWMDCHIWYKHSWSLKDES